jgi:hypothetical protein
VVVVFIVRDVLFQGVEYMNLLIGTDPLSLEILDSLSDGMKVKDIPNSFSVSLDQAKRLSRYHRILGQAKSSLSIKALDLHRTKGIVNKKYF